MGKIIYKPHCSNCGTLITEKVQYRNINNINSYSNNGINSYTEIYPNRCSSCGQPFDGVKIPTSEELASIQEKNIIRSR